MGIFPKNFLLNNKTAVKLYDRIVKNLPIIDYHCHLSPQEIYENKVFSDVGKMWLEFDHYRWRLMRLFGVSEEYVTGGASYAEKFKKYAETVETAAGSPMYHWSNMELGMYFNIDAPLNAKNAEDIFSRCNAYIEKTKMTPRSLIEKSNVKYVGTTDDVISPLDYHKFIAEDKGIDFTVAPSFRADNLVLIRRPDYLEWVGELGKIVGRRIQTIEDYEYAIINRLDFFVSRNCRIADMGIEFFPNVKGYKVVANKVLTAVLSGRDFTQTEYEGFLFYIHCFLAKEYKKRNIISQIHMGVKRNPNTKIYGALGLDRGTDCIGKPIDYGSVIALLDEMHANNGLPKTILYVLNPADAFPVATISGAFPDVFCGAAWWFGDNIRKIRDQIKNIAEAAHLGRFFGMTTDSRSFLSYARHDYFRRILCDVLGEYVETGEFIDDENLNKLLYNICYGNISRELGVK